MLLLGILDTQCLDLISRVGQQIVSTIKIERACLSWNLFVIYEPKTVTVDKNALAVALSITAVALGIFFLHNI